MTPAPQISAVRRQAARPVSSAARTLHRWGYHRQRDMLLRTVLRVDPVNIEALIRLAQTHSGDQEAKLALAWRADAAFAMRPASGEDANYRKILAGMLERSGELPPAIRHWHVLAAHAPEFAKPPRELAALESRDIMGRGRTARAEGGAAAEAELLQPFVSAHPDQLGPLVALARAWLSNREFEVARRLSEAATALIPQVPDQVTDNRRRSLAIALERVGNFAGAAAQLRAVSATGDPATQEKIAQLDYRDTLARARIAEGAEDFAEARALLLEVLGSRPGDVPVLTRLARICLAEDDIPAARAFADQALASDPTAAEAHFATAQVAERAADRATALNAWRGAIAATGWEASDNATPGRRELVRRAGRFPFLIFAARSPDVPDVANPAAAGAAEILALGDDLIRLYDDRALFGLIEQCARSTVLPHPDIIAHMLEAKVFFRHHGFRESLALAEALLGDPRLDEALGAEAEARRFDLLGLRLRCLSRLSRYAEADALLADPPLAPAEELNRLDTAVWWREAPERGLANTMALGFPSREQLNETILFCYLPLLAGDAERADDHAGICFARLRADGRAIPPDLLVCAAKTKLALGELDAYAKLVDAYFETYRLSNPGAPGQRLDFSTLRSTGRPVADGPLVTVILTAYNSAATIDYAVRSLTEQTYRNLELILVDDCSTDDSFARIQAFAAADNRIVALRNERNCGTYVSKNHALRRARGAYFTCHDADDWAHPRRIELHVAAMTDHPDLVATRSNWLRMDPSGSPVIRPWAVRFTHDNPASLFCRREVVEAIGYYDSVWIDGDMDYRLRVMTRFGPERVAFLAAPLTIGRADAGSLTTSGSGAQNKEGYNDIRCRYRAGILRWRREQILTGGDFFVGDRPDSRMLAAAEPIKVWETGGPPTPG